jgi:hypothetical protein
MGMAQTGVLVHMSEYSFKCKLFDYTGVVHASKGGDMRTGMVSCQCSGALLTGLLLASGVQAASSAYLEGCIAEQVAWQKHQGDPAPSSYRIEKYCRCLKEDVQAHALPSQADDMDEFPNHKPRWLLTLEGHARHLCEPLLGHSDAH